jgi:hypothetical protein
MKNLITNFTAHANFQEALDANEAITGTYFYAGLADSERRSHEDIMENHVGGVVTYYTNPLGRIVMDYVLPSYVEGERHLTELTRHTAVTAGSIIAFNFTDNGINLLREIDKGDLAERRKAMIFADGVIDESLVLSLMMDLNKEAA